ncbi:MAG: hypothetical protein HQM09_14970 [Candidatus Riflebacteria bacterium]|nr:hypothetical protein [Candidatus Riflebacteria bacterium]
MKPEQIVFLSASDLRFLMFRSVMAPGQLLPWNSGNTIGDDSHGGTDLQDV